MNRQRKRQATRELQKLSEDALTLVGEYVEIEANKRLDLFKDLVNDAVFNAMRCNRVSSERAYRIMEQANQYMIEEVQNSQKKVS